jgi:hypothetical protein
MKSLLRYTVLTFALAVGASTLAHATPCATTDRNCKPAAAPEVDPSLAAVGVSLLAGGLAVLRARGRK